MPDHCNIRRKQLASGCGPRCRWPSEVGVFRSCGGGAAHARRRRRRSGSGATRRSTRATRGGRSGRAASEATRDAAARLIGADRDEIALVPNTTAGISLVAEGLDWRPGDNVVTLADEFPSNVYPWLNLASRGVETRRVPTDNGRLDLDDLAAACDARTRIVSVSWVGYATGYRHDVERIVEIAHERGALMMLDAIQGLGVFPLDVRQDADRLSGGRRAQVDARAGGGGHRVHSPRAPRPVAAVRRRLAQRGAMRATTRGSSSNLKPSAARYEGGSQNMVGMLGFGASLELLLELGMRERSRRRFWTSPIGPASGCSRLGRRSFPIAPDHRDGEQRSGIVAFELAGPRSAGGEEALPDAASRA